MNIVDNPKNINPDLTATQHHLERLFRRCQDECPDTTLQLDRSEVDGQAWISHQFPTTVVGIAQAVQWAMDWNSAGWNIYVGANPRKLGLDHNKSATDKDIHCAFFSFGDLDSEESLEIAKAGMPINNTYSTNTGTTPWRRCHLYWEHENPVYNLEAWRQTQVGIANYFKGDSVIDPRRILRLAGCVNYPTAKKRDKGYIAETATIQTEFDGEERDPVDTVHLHTTYAGTPTASVTPGSEGSKGGLGLPTFGPGVELQKTLDAIQEGNWHNAVRDQVASWVAIGWPADAIRLSCLAFTQPGYTTEQTTTEVDVMLRGAIDKGYAPEPVHAPPPVTPSVLPDLILKSMTQRPSVREIPLREFVYGKHLIRKFTSATISPGGVGKTTLMMIEAVAMAAQQSLLGVKIYEKNLRVLHINLEDPQDELNRRYYAILDHFNLDHVDIGKRVFIHSGRDRKVILAEKGDNGLVIQTPDVDQLRTQIIENSIDVVSIDPLVKSHYADENDNKAIDSVLDIFAQLANDTNTAIDLAHHVRKTPTGIVGLAGDINQARGASALAGAVRAARTLTVMSTKEAEGFGIQGERSRWYVREDDAKGNMSPPAENAVWMERHSITIDNGDN
ncbi:MAG: AAA family ATPase, partial [Rhodospirillales bacterium]|nr:AAA family ATPase [Rhodospirillales bacterium]